MLCVKAGVRTWLGRVLLFLGNEGPFKAFPVVLKGHLAEVWGTDLRETPQEGNQLEGHCDLLDEKEPGGGEGRRDGCKRYFIEPKLRDPGFTVGGGQRTGWV